MDMNYHGLYYDHNDAIDAYAALPDVRIRLNNKQLSPMQQGLRQLATPLIIARREFIDGKRKLKALN